MEDNGGFASGPFPLGVDSSESEKSTLGERVLTSSGPFEAHNSGQTIPLDGDKKRQIWSVSSRRCFSLTPKMIR
jgi:hypothetical protein